MKIFAATLETERLEGRDEGRKEGLEEGRKEAITTIAQKMKSEGIARSIISGITGLDEDVIISLT